MTEHLFPPSHRIATYINETLNNLEIQNKCVAFGGDNCTTMFGGLTRGVGNDVFATVPEDVD